MEMRTILPRAWDVALWWGELLELRRPGALVATPWQWKSLLMILPSAWEVARWWTELLGMRSILPRALEMRALGA